MKLTLICIFIVCLTNIGCKVNEQDNKINESVYGTINYAYITVNEYGTDKNEVWYYPYEFVFGISFYNNEDSIISMNIYDVFEDDHIVNGNFILTYESDTFFLGPDYNLSIYPNDSINKSFFIMDLPFFKRAFKQKEFKDYFNDLTSNIQCFIENDTINGIYYKISLSDNFYYKFLHWDKDVININNVGVPEEVKQNFEPPKPIYGIEY